MKYAQTRLYAIRLALELLPKERAHDVVTLLEDRDRFVSRAAIEWLTFHPSPTARAVLAQRQRLMADYANDVEDILRRDGINVSEVRADSIWIQPGPIGLDLKASFGTRGAPDHFDQLVDRVRKQLARQRDRGFKR